MDEVLHVLAILKDLRIREHNQRASLLGKFLTANDDHVSLESFDLYFNRSQNEQIDMQVGSCTFNLGEWTGALHKLSELLLLKGAKIQDIERLHAMFLSQPNMRR